VEEGDRARWSFEVDRPLDRAGLVAGPFVRVEARAARGASLDALVFRGDEKGAEALLETARRAIERYAARFGPVDARGYTLVEMPEAFGSSSGYGESDYALLGPGAFRSAGTAAWADSTVAHEIAHTWWGHEVGFTTFASESLACYAALGFLEAEKGPDAARVERRRALAALAKASAAGKRVALAEIQPWGRGMDPETYQVHAYEKGMLLLSMVEDALGRKAMDAALAAFFAKYRGARVDWRELRDALAAAGPAARTVLEQGEAAGHPVITVAHETKKQGALWVIEGTLAQEGTAKPWKIPVTVAAHAGEKSVAETVRFDGPTAKFRLVLPAEPESVVVDPEGRLLAEFRVPGAKDPKEVVERVIGKIANSAALSDPKVLEPAIAELRALLRSGAGEMEPVCHTGIGRMLFRLGRHGEAKESLQTALAMGAGGPFHQAWCHLRLGCIADLEGLRRDAKAHYERARGPGASKSTATMADLFLERPYRGYAQDR
jgi:hypothetical protein